MTGVPETTVENRAMRLLVLVVAFMSMVSCGRGGTGSPSSPTPTSQPEPTPTPQVPIEMVTTTQNLAISGGGNMCPGYWDYGELPDVCKVDYVFKTHYGGTLTAEVTWTDRDTVPFMELYRSSDGVPLGQPIQSTADTPTLRAELSARAEYMIRVQKFAQSGGSPPVGSTTFRLTVTRPN
jgi:hypothetical protein